MRTVEEIRLRRVLLWTAFALFCVACVAALLFILGYLHVLMEGLGGFSNSPGTRPAP